MYEGKNKFWSQKAHEPNKAHVLHTSRITLKPNSKPCYSYIASNPNFSISFQGNSLRALKRQGASNATQRHNDMQQEIIWQDCQGWFRK